MTSAWSLGACFLGLFALPIACGSADAGASGDVTTRSSERQDEGVFPISSVDGDRRLRGKMDALALDADWVYVAGGGIVLRIPRSGGSEQLLTNHWQGHRRSGQPRPGGSGYDPRDVYRPNLALDDHYIYWCETKPELFGAEGDPDHTGRIMRMMKGGGQAESILDGLDDPSSLLIDGDTMYWTDGPLVSQTSSVKRWVDFRSLTHEPETLATARLARQLQVENGHVFFVSDEDDGSSVRRVPVTGGEPETLVEKRGRITSLAVRDGRLAWVESPDCMNCGGAFVWSRETGTVTTVRTLRVGDGAALVDGTFHFGTTAEEPVKDGTRISTIFAFDGRSVPLRTITYERVYARPVSVLAADASRVYWLDYDLGLTFGTDTILRSVAR